MTEDIASAGSDENPRLCAVDDVDIDKSGTFKYVLIKVHDKEKEGEYKHIVRGSLKEYHADIYDDVLPGIEANKLECECVGGGRILHDPSKKFIKIYGYSQGFGRAKHAVTQDLIKRKYGADYSVTWSNDGY